MIRVLVCLFGIAAANFSRDSCTSYQCNDAEWREFYGLSSLSAPDQGKADYSCKGNCGLWQCCANGPAIPAGSFSQVFSGIIGAAEDNGERAHDAGSQLTGETKAHNDLIAALDERLADAADAKDTGNNLSNQGEGDAAKAEAALADTTDKQNQVNNDNARANSEMKEANDNYEAQEKSTRQSIAAIERVIPMLKRGGMALLQGEQKNALKQAVVALTQSYAADKAEAAVQSLLMEDDTSVVDMLTTMKSEAVEALNKAKMDLVKGNGQLKQDITRNAFLLESLAKDAQRQKAAKAAGEGNAGEGAKQVADADAEAERAGSIKSQANNAWKKRVASLRRKLGNAEEDAEAARNTVKSFLENVMGASKGEEPAAFLQIKNVEYSSRDEAVKVLSRAAQKSGSSVLAQMAIHAKDDAFGKVKGLLNGMINTKSEELEAIKEAHAKCEMAIKNAKSDLAGAQQTRDSRAAETEKADGEVAQMKRAIQAEQKAAADQQAAVTEQQENLDSLVQHNTQLASKLQKNVNDLGGAIDILKKDSAAEKVQDFISLFEKQHQKAADALDATNTETSTEKANMAKASQALAIGSAQSKAKIDGMKEQEAILESNSQDGKESLKTADEALANSQQLFDDQELKCKAQAPLSVEEKAAIRNQEITALKTALDILS